MFPSRVIAAMLKLAGMVLRSFFLIKGKRNHVPENNNLGKVYLEKRAKQKYVLVEKQKKYLLPLGSLL